MTERISIERCVLEQAIEALEGSTDLVRDDCQHVWKAVTALRAALEAQQAPAEQDLAMAPEGWKVVPVEPTEEMLRSGCRCESPAMFKESLRRETDGPKTVEMVEKIIRRHLASYRAMLAAAPQPPKVVAHPQQAEPVAWMNAGGGVTLDPYRASCWRDSGPVTPLFTYAKPPRGPLSEEEILKTGIPEQLWFAKRFGSAPAEWTDEQIRTHDVFQGAVVELVRAIESAHGIRSKV